MEQPFTEKHSPKNAQPSSYPSSAEGIRYYAVPMQPIVTYQALRVQTGQDGHGSQDTIYGSYRPPPIATVAHATFMPGSRPGMRYLEVMKNGRKAGKSQTASQSNGINKMAKTFQRNELMMEEESIEKLQAEQKDIEAKLKFIDGLINNQQSSSVPKYLGGGILKKPAQKEFAENLEQYQRAIKDLKEAMNNITTPSAQTQTQPMHSAFDFEHLKGVESEKDQTPVHYFQSEEVSQEDFQRMRHSRQILNLKQAVLGNSYMLQGGDSRGETDKISVSSHFTTDAARLYDATLLRNSFQKGQEPRSHDESYVSTVPEVPQPVVQKVVQRTHIDTAFIPPILMEDTSSNRSLIYLKERATGRSLVKQGAEMRQSPIPTGQSKKNSPFRHKSKASSLYVELRPQAIDDSREVGVTRQTTAGAIPKVDVTLDSQDQQAAMNKTAGTFHQRVANKVRQLNEASSSPWRNAARPEQALLGNDGLSNPQAFTKQLLLRKQEKLPKPPPKPVEKTRNVIQQTTNHNSTEKMNIQDETQITVEVTTRKLPIKAVSSPVFDGSIRMEIGKKAQVLLNKHATSQLQIVDKNVIYQENGDHTQGVLYFKNMDSLKGFLGKKRSVFSKQGEKITHYNEPKQLGLIKPAHLDLNAEQQLKADIAKKRHFLHKTLSNFLPKQKIGKARVPQHETSGITQPNESSQSPERHTNSSTQWGPIQNFKQYNFEDVMTPEGIIDLKVFGSMSPNPARCLSREGGAPHVRSESSPGVSRNHLSRRLQTFYGINNPSASFNGHPLRQQTADAVSSLKGFDDDKPRSMIESKLQGTDDGGSLNEIEKSSLMENSDQLEGDQSQITNPRHIVFFRTSIRIKEDNIKPDAQLSLIPQHAFFKARLGTAESKASSRDYMTIGINKRFINSTNMIQSQETSKRQEEKAQVLKKMNLGIERSKLRNLPAKHLDQRPARTAIGYAYYQRGSPKASNFEESPERQKSHNLPNVSRQPPLMINKSYGAFQTHQTSSSFFTLLGQREQSRNLVQSSFLGAATSSKQHHDSINRESVLSSGSSKVQAKTDASTAKVNVREILARRAQLTTSHKTLKALMKQGQNQQSSLMMTQNISDNKIPL